MPVEDSTPRLLTCFADTSAAPFHHLATQPFVALLGDPDKREMDCKRRLGATARVTHAPECTENRLKLLPKGGDFALPIGDTNIVRTLAMLLISMISFPLVFIRNNSMFQATMMYIVMILAILLVFIYAPNEQMQGIVQKIFYFHVSSSVTAFSAFFLVFVASIMYLWKNAEWWDAVALSAAEIGVVFCTLVLITGPIWARPIWGTWWSWDPTLTLTLVLWLIYVAYLMLRMDAHDPKRARFAAVLGIVGYVDIPLILWSVEKWRTLHPKPVLLQEGGTSGLPLTMLITFAVCLVAFMLLFFYLLRERVSIIQSQHTIEALRHQVDNLPTG